MISSMQEALSPANSRFWDKQARKYSRSAIADPGAYEQTLERVRAHLRASDHMLEIGCGTGSTALELASSVRAITATDLSQEMITIAKEKAQAQGIENVEFLRSDAANPALGQQQYDVITAFNLLHLVDDMPSLLKQIHGMLKPGGLFISKTFCLPDAFSLKVSAIRAVLPVMQLLGKAPEVSFWKVSEFDDLVANAGFSLEELGCYPEQPPRRFIVARK